MKKRVFAVDLTWVRPHQIGGTESYVRNLLDGIGQLGRKDFQAVLLLAKDNYSSFRKYSSFSCYQLFMCNTISASQKKRVIWQNIKMGRLLRKKGIDICFEPVYGKPFFGTGGIRFYTTIHDLQAYHFPEYFSRSRVLWMKLSWWNAVHTSERIFAISDFVKEDIMDKYRCSPDKISVIYNPLYVENKGKKKTDVSSRYHILEDRPVKEIDVFRKYHIEEHKYYYTVSSLLAHKNLETVIKALAELKHRHSQAFFPLVISGINGREKDKWMERVQSYGMDSDVVFTGFVSSFTRDLLYRSCKAFLFPSVFEGFGMPPVEAMISGAPVITTDKTSLPEVTDHKANYVTDAWNPDAWIKVLEEGYRPTPVHVSELLLEKYDIEKIASSYLALVLAD